MTIAGDTNAPIPTVAVVTPAARAPPRKPPSAAPTILKIAFPAPSPDSKDTIPTIRGPTIGTLPKNFETNGLAALNPGAINFAALPNNFTANPPIFCAPFTAPFFNPPVIVFFNPFFPTLLRNFLPPRPISLPILALPFLTAF